MKKFLLFIFVLVAGHSGLAQNSKKVIGKWAYAEIHDKAKTNPENIEMTNMLFKDFTINFRHDGSMTLHVMKKSENGRYEFNTGSDNELSIVSASGKSNNATIIEVDDKEMIISLGDTGAMRLKKVSDVPDVLIEKAPTPKVAATFQQIIGKWNLVDMEREKKSNLFSELIKGSYIEFFDDNTYQTKILRFEENGVWELADGNTVIEIETAEDKGFWNIIQISATDLTLQRPEGKMYYFKKP